MRILVVDDDADIRLFLKNRLLEKGFAVDSAEDGEQGSFLARINDYDLIILDYTMPKKNGFDVCVDIRNQENTFRAHTPIIMLSVIDEVPIKVEGLHLGADDYVTKPFFFNELYARIIAIIRRPRVREHSEITIDDLCIDIDRQEVTRADRSIYLTRKEFSLLEYLARNRGQVLSRGNISEHVWDMNLDPFSNTIETHILNLRKKIEPIGTKKLIHSVPGRGYKIDEKR